MSTNQPNPYKQIADAHRALADQYDAMGAFWTLATQAPAVPIGAVTGHPNFTSRGGGLPDDPRDLDESDEHDAPVESEPDGDESTDSADNATTAVWPASHPDVIEAATPEQLERIAAFFADPVPLADWPKKRASILRKIERENAQTNGNGSSTGSRRSDPPREQGQKTPTATRTYRLPGDP